MVRSLALAHGQAGHHGQQCDRGFRPTPPRVAMRDQRRAPTCSSRCRSTGAPVTPEDIAAAVAFFLDRRSGYITGQILHCCGGASLLSSLSV